MTGITLPLSLTEMGVNPFYNSGINTIKIPILNTSFAVLDDALYNKTEKSLIYYFGNRYRKEFTVPKGIRSIGEHAFDSCSLHDITLPDTLIRIGDQAFFNCDEMRSIAIPDSVTEIGVNPFLHSAAYTVLLSESHPVFALHEDTLYNKVEGRIIAYFDTKVRAENIILDGTRSIGDYAFANSYVARVILPDGFTSIGEFAFSMCLSLVSITLPDGFMDIGHYAFANCRNLSDVTIPESVMFIGDNAFINCYSLKPTVFPDTYAEAYMIAQPIPYSYPKEVLYSWLDD